MIPFPWLVGGAGRSAWKVVSETLSETSGRFFRYQSGMANIVFTGGYNTTLHFVGSIYEVVCVASSP